MGAKGLPHHVVFITPRSDRRRAVSEHEQELRNELGALQEAVLLAVRDYLEELLRATNYNVKQAARIADVNRTHLYKLMRKCGVQPKREGRAHRGQWDRPIPSDW